MLQGVFSASTQRETNSAEKWPLGFHCRYTGSPVERTTTLGPCGAWHFFVPGNVAIIVVVVAIVPVAPIPRSPSGADMETGVAAAIVTQVAAVNGVQNPADLGTKALSRPRLEFLCGRLGLHSASFASGDGS